MAEIYEENNNNKSLKPYNYKNNNVDNNKEQEKKIVTEYDQSKDKILNNLSRREIREFREAFRLFDKDDDGEITIAELQEVFQGLNYHFTEKQLQKMIGMIDIDGNGKIDLNEFIVMMKAENYHDPNNCKSFNDELRDAFDVFDKDGNGNIEPQELASTMQALGENLTPADIKLMIGEFDDNGDGVIDFEEFKQLMQEDHLLFNLKHDENERTHLPLKNNNDSDDDDENN